MPITFPRSFTAAGRASAPTVRHLSSSYFTSLGTHARVDSLDLEPQRHATRSAHRALVWSVIAYNLLRRARYPSTGSHVVEFLRMFFVLLIARCVPLAGGARAHGVVLQRASVLATDGCVPLGACHPQKTRSASASTTSARCSAAPLPPPAQRLGPLPRPPTPHQSPPCPRELLQPLQKTLSWEGRPLRRAARSFACGGRRPGGPPIPMGGTPYLLGTLHR